MIAAASLSISVSTTSSPMIGSAGHAASEGISRGQSCGRSRRRNHRILLLRSRRSLREGCRDRAAPFHRISQPFGGARRLLGCPGCGRQCRILYFGTDRLRCRLCLGMRYRSQNMQRGDRALAQAAKIARRIDPKTLDIDEMPEKPPRMRWRTYHRLAERHADHMDRWAEGLMARLGIRL